MRDRARAFRAAGAMAVTLALCGCSARPAPLAAWHDAGGYRWRALTVSTHGGAGFTPLAPGKTGVGFTDIVPDDSIFANRHEAHGAGVALGDVDGDGRPDVFLAGMMTPSVLYHNAGGMRFEDSTAASRIDTRGRHVTGAALVDVDGDGDLDLLLAMLGGPNALWLNDGKGHFTDVTKAAGLEAHAGSTSMALADVDGNGTLDLYVATYKTRNAQDVYAPQERAFDQVVRKYGDRYEVVPAFQREFRVTNREDLGAVVRTQRAEPDLFYLNDGRGHFTRVPLASAHFLDEEGRPLAEEPDFFGLSVAFHDLNGDGRPDLYVCNDFEDPDQIWINQGNATFRLIPKLAVRATSNSCMSVTFSDVDHDGHDDVFTADMRANDSHLLKTEIPTHTPLPKGIGVFDDRPQWQRNALQLNRGDGTFAQVAEAAGIDASGWSWGSTFVDVDLDGWEDLLIANGHAFDAMDADTWEKLRTQFVQYDWHRELSLFPRLPQHNVAFRNGGGLRFTDVSGAWHIGDDADVSHGIATADLDGDGDQDAIVTRNGMPPLVLRNDATVPRIAVRLRGAAPNTEGIGARIHVLGGAVPEQTKEIQAAGLYLSSADATVSFAAGRARALTIVVDWPDGARSTIADASPNRAYEIERARAVARPDSSGTAAAPLFTDATPLLHGQRHAETPYDDFARQPLLDMRYSQLGPGVSWYDVDGDGQEDLLVPSGKGGALAWLRNDHGRFTAMPLHAAATLDQTTVLAIPTAGAGTTLLVGQSSYEAPTPAEALAAPAVVQVDPRRGTATPLVGGDTASMGAMALADVDGDGDLDLFVAGRVVPGSYPLAAPSRLYRNDGGRFSLDTVNAPALRTVGLVSGAIFTDVNGDGQPDLVLAPEWGTIVLLLNDHGRLTRAPASWGLGEVSSRWNGLAAVDLDGDGRMDLVATSWGRNTVHRVDARHPLWLYYGNLGGRAGGVDLVLAQMDDRLKGVAPVAGLGRLTSAMPALRDHIPTYAAYADMKIDAVLGEQAAAARKLVATTLDHVALMNRGGRFETVPLPMAAQLAPSFGVTVGDVNGDGHEDVVLAQNFYQTDVETPRYDAGRGLVLLGDGKGGLAPLAAPLSGLAVYGDARGAALADYDGDGRADLAVTQNGAETRLYHNTGATPGLRVRLAGPPGNPHAYGAAMRIVYADGTRGPVRELHGGGGYWSLDGAVQVLGLAKVPGAVWVRWPGGGETTTPVPAGAGELRIAQPGVAVARR